MPSVEGANLQREMIFVKINLAYNHMNSSAILGNSCTQIHVITYTRHIFAVLYRYVFWRKKYVFFPWGGIYIYNIYVCVCVCVCSVKGDVSSVKEGT